MYPRLVITAILVVSAVTDGRLGSHLMAGAAAQTPAQAVFSARSELVVLHVLVRDRKGAYVADLMQDAFTVLEDGQRQTVQFFERQDAPVTVGLLIDSSGSMIAVRDRVVVATGAFAETSNPEDEIFALAFNEEVRAALSPEAPFTSDPETLRGALRSVTVAYGRTALYDAILAGLEYVGKGRHPRKVLVILSDGGDNASAATLDRVLEQAQVANTVIYTIGIIDPVNRDANPKLLKQLAEASGGEAFRPRDVLQINDALQRIAHDIRNTYTIGYVPGDAAPVDRIRRIRVIVNAPNRPALTVRTRQGYGIGER